jgi:hypothetical protein
MKKPDWKVWCVKETVTVWQAPLLSLDIDPAIFDSATFAIDFDKQLDAQLIPAIRQEYGRRLKSLHDDLLDRRYSAIPTNNSLGFPSCWDEVRLEEFAAWSELSNFEIPTALSEIAKSYGGAKRLKVDYEKRKRNEEIEWWDGSLHANTFWILKSVTPLKAAKLLCRFNPHTDGDSVPLTETTDETTPEDFQRLLEVFADEHKADPKSRTLQQWHATAHDKQLRHHSWICRYSKAMDADEASNKGEAQEQHAVANDINTPDWSIWSTKAELTLWEAVALSLNLAPEKFDPKKIDDVTLNLPESGWTGGPYTPPLYQWERDWKVGTSLHPELISQFSKRLQMLVTDLPKGDIFSGREASDATWAFQLVRFSEFALWCAIKDFECVAAISTVGKPLLKLRQEKEARDSGRYAIRLAAEIIIRDSGGNVNAMEENLRQAALSGQLAVYRPGESATCTFLAGTAKTDEVVNRVTAGRAEAYWDDLNTWLGANEKRITFRFPAPAESKPQNDAPPRLGEEKKSTTNRGLDRDGVLAHAWPLSNPNFTNESLANALSDVRDWLVTARLVPGRRGKNGSALWSPVLIAVALIGKNYARQNAIDGFIAANFPDWLEDWNQSKESL